MSDPGRLRTEIDGAIGWLVIDAPARRNALGVQMWLDFPARLAELDAHPKVRAIVVRGEGEKAFASGADISEFETARVDSAANRQFVRHVLATNAAFDRLCKPCIAMIHGACMGGGIVIALGCDMRFASEDAQFAIPAGRLGLGYEAEGVRRLIRVIGPAFAMEMLSTGRRVAAHEAERMGLVNRVSAAAELERLIRRVADEIAANAPLTLKAARAATIDALHHPEASPAPGVQAAIDACFDSEDFREGRAAFREKRSPRFQGQ